MKALVDTHVFLWAITDDPHLSKVHRDLYLDNTNQLHLSVASLWEMLIKASLGKLPLPIPATSFLMKQMEKNRIEMLSIRAAHLAELESLPPLHRDPFDRMMIAQAKAEGMAILSVNSEMGKYGVRVL